MFLFLRCVFFFFFNLSPWQRAVSDYVNANIYLTPFSQVNSKENLTWLNAGNLQEISVSSSPLVGAPKIRAPCSWPKRMTELCLGEI